MNALDITATRFNRLTDGQRTAAWRWLQREWDRLNLNERDTKFCEEYWSDARSSTRRWTLFCVLRRAVVEGLMTESVKHFIDKSA